MHVVYQKCHLNKHKNNLKCIYRLVCYSDALTHLCTMKADHLKHQHTREPLNTLNNLEPWNTFLTGINCTTVQRQLEQFDFIINTTEECPWRIRIQPVQNYLNPFQKELLSIEFESEQKSINNFVAIKTRDGTCSTFTFPARVTAVFPAHNLMSFSISAR